MYKKALGTFLMGTLFFFCSCIDDTYDLNKEISTDVAIKGNKLALPLGNLKTIVLDSLLDVSSISDFLKVDSASRVYSLSLNDSLVSSVAQKDLEVLKEVSKLSSDIDPISIDLEEIRFKFPSFDHSDSMSFQNVELSDVSFDAIHEEVTMNLGEISLDPISIEENTHNVNFNIPTVELNDVFVEEYSQTVSFNIDDIVIENVATETINEEFVVEMKQIPMDEITTPTFNSNLTTMLQDDYVKLLLQGKDDSEEIGNIPSFPFEVTMGDKDSVDVQFHYTLPKEINRLNKVEMANSDSNNKGSLVEFKVVNPKLAEGLNRSINFSINFPKNYKLALYQDEYFTLSEDGCDISVNGMPAEGETTYIRFYLKEISGLADEKYYRQDENGRTLLFDDKIKCDVTYMVSGTLALPQGTTFGDIKKGLTYSVGLDVSFDIKEAYGSTNSIESDFKQKDIDFSFSLEDLEYITHIDKVVLDPSVSKLSFATKIDKSFDGFNIDYPNSKILLAFPEEFVFSDDAKIPDGVKRVAGTTNQFEISSVSAFDGEEWVLPVREVMIDGAVVDGTLNFETTAVIKAVTGNKEDILTIKPEDNVALIETAQKLCDTRTITLKAEPIEIAVADVQGKTNPIDIAFENRAFDFDFDITGNLDYVEEIDYVEFDANKKVYITSSAEKGFGNMNFEEGTYIAIRFPEEFIFDIPNSTLPYDENLNAFIINDLSQLKSGRWSLALQRVNVNKEVVNGVLNFKASVTIEAVNAHGQAETLYVVGGEKFSLDEMRKQNIFGEQNIRFAVEEFEVSVKEMQGKTNDINVDFESQEVGYTFALDELDYITHVGNIELKAGNNFLLFNSQFSGDVGRFNLARNSHIDFIFPAGFEFDPSNSSIPTGMVQFVENNTRIRISDIKALDSTDDWKLAVKRINIDQDIIDRQFNADYTIRVVGYDANGVEGKLTVAALENLLLSEVQEAGGERTITVSLLPCDIIIEDIEASVGDIDFDFDKQTFTFPVTIDKLDLVKEINYISFEKGRNIINLNIALSEGVEPFELASNNAVKITFPENFVLDLENCDFGNLKYEENAIHITQIKDLLDCKLKLAIDRININQVIENNQFDWTGEISVTALNTATNEENKLYIGGIENLKLSDITAAMGDKTITFDIPNTELRIDEAVLVSNKVVADIEESIEIPIDETIAEPIDQVNSIGFVDPVPLTLTVKTKGLENIAAPVNLSADIVLPPVFVINSKDDKVTVTDKGLHIETSHVFKESSDIKFELYVNSLDFNTLEGGYLTLPTTEDGKRKLQYDGEASIIGSVSLDNAQLSSDLLNTGVSLDIAFEMGEIVLKDFTGIYGGTIKTIADTIELGIEDSFAELEENGLTLSNTKPELMVSLYNTIGVPVDVDFLIVGRDKEGNEIRTSKIEVNDLRIEPAKLEQEVLVADTTRWLFTSNKEAYVPNYNTVVIENLDSLLNRLPHSIEFKLEPEIVTEGVVHRVDLSKPLELGGSYSISVPFDLQFAQSIPLELGEEVNEILNNKNNKLTLANPQLALAIHNPIAQDLVFNLSLIGKDANDQPISTASLVFDEPFVLKAGTQNPDGTITPTATRWLFAVNDTIKKEGYDTKSAPALGTLLNELPHNIDIKLNAHFNTDLTTKIDYDNDLELMCEYGVFIPLQFEDLHFNYTDTISDIQLDLEEMIADMNLSIYNMGLALSMNLKNTLPLGLTLNLTPLDAEGNVIKGIEISSIELPAGNGSDIATSDAIDATPVEITIKCKSASDISLLDKISFSIDVASGNGNNALGGKQGLQISDIVLQVMCDVEMDLNQ